jgi:hypothetical protein
MKCFIISYNRLTCLKNIAERLYKLGFDINIIDNHSSYQPLLDWYKTIPYNIIMMDANYTHTVFWSKQLYKNVIGERYIVTDPDLDISEIPDDFITFLNKGLDKYPSFDKCGFSLKINDLPDTPIANEAKGWEQKFWQCKLDDMYYAADIDTTFSLYRENANVHILKALRTEAPYCAKHIPWYYTNFEELPEDEQFYYNSSKSCTFWSKYIKK